MLCTPALVYLVLSIIGIIYYLFTFSIGNVLLQTFFMLIWTWLLNYICSCGYEVVSWILVILPIILVPLFAYLFFRYVVKDLELNEKYTNIRYM
jgi:hypothetical protein